MNKACLTIGFKTDCGSDLVRIKPSISRWYVAIAAWSLTAVTQHAARHERRRRECGACETPLSARSTCPSTSRSQHVRCIPRRMRLTWVTFQHYHDVLFEVIHLRQLLPYVQIVAPSLWKSRNCFAQKLWFFPRGMPSNQRLSSISEEHLLYHKHQHKSVFSIESGLLDHRQIPLIVSVGIIHSNSTTRSTGMAWQWEFWNYQIGWIIIPKSPAAVGLKPVNIYTRT